MPPGLHALGRRAQQLELQLGQRLRRASAGRVAAPGRRAPSTAHRRARGRTRSRRGRGDRRSRPARSARCPVRAPRRGPDAPRPRSPRPRASPSCRPAPRTRRGSARPAGSRRRARPAATPGSSPASAPDRRGRRHTRPARRSARPTGSAARTSSAGGSFCARISSSASSWPKSRSQTSAIQSGYESFSGPSGSDATSPLNPWASRRMTAFVNGTARSSPAARTSSTASSVTACAGLVGPGELVRAEPQRGDHRRVELPHRPLAELLDAVVDRSGPAAPSRTRAAARARGRGRRAPRRPTRARDRRTRPRRTRAARPRRRPGAPARSPQAAQKLVVAHARGGPRAEPRPGTNRPSSRCARQTVTRRSWSDRPGADVRRQRPHAAAPRRRDRPGRARGRPARSSRRTWRPPPAAARTPARRRRTPSSSRAAISAHRSYTSPASSSAERERLLRGDRPAVELGDRAVDRHPGRLVAGEDRPLDRRGAAPARQERRMDVQPQRPVEQRRRDVEPVRADDDDRRRRTRRGSSGRSGWSTGMPRRLAASLAGGAASFGRGPAAHRAASAGRATSCAPASRSRTSAPNAAVAATAMRMPLSGGRRAAAGRRAPACGARRRCGR